MPMPSLAQFSLGARMFTKKRVYTVLCILGWGLLFAVLGVPGPNWNTDLQARLSDTGAAK